MKSLFAIILTILMATLAYGADSKIALFDESQRADAKFSEKEIEAWTQIDLQSAQYHLEWEKVTAADRKRDRLIFVFKLENDPDTIHWQNLAWIHPGDSSGKTKSYTNTSTEYKGLTAEIENQISRIKTLKDQQKRRNELYEVNKATFDRLEADLISEQLSLQKRMDTVRNLRAQQPAADGHR